MRGPQQRNDADSVEQCATFSREIQQPAPEDGGRTLSQTEKCEQGRVKLAKYGQVVRAEVTSPKAVRCGGGVRVSRASQYGWLHRGISQNQNNFILSVTENSRLVQEITGSCRKSGLISGTMENTEFRS